MLPTLSRRFNCNVNARRHFAFTNANEYKRRMMNDTTRPAYMKRTRGERCSGTAEEAMGLGKERMERFGEEEDEVMPGRSARMIIFYTRRKTRGWEESGDFAYETECRLSRKRFNHYTIALSTLCDKYGGVRERVVARPAIVFVFDTNNYYYFNCFYYDAAFWTTTRTAHTRPAELRGTEAKVEKEECRAADKNAEQRPTRNENAQVNKRQKGEGILPSENNK